MIDELFQFHKLNKEGQDKAVEIAQIFTEFLHKVTEVIERPGTSGSILLPQSAMNHRYISAMRSKLEEACFLAKKAMAVLPENQ